MDWQSIQPFFDWLADHSVLAGIFVFFIAFTESLLIVGLIVPGTILMFGVGALVGAGALQFWDTIIIAFFGAVCGDAVSFLIGKHYHHHVVKIWPFKNHPNYIKTGETFFHKHGGKSILFGRFVGPVRPLIPAIAGMMGMSQSYFFFVNVLSAAGWAPFYLIPGIVFGSSLGLAAEVGSRLVILLLVSISLVILFSWLLKYFYLSMLPWFQRKFISWYQTTTASRALVAVVFEEKVVLQRGAILFSSISILLVCFVLAFIANVKVIGESDIDLIIARLFMVIQSSPISGVYNLILPAFEWVGLSFIVLNFVLLSLYFKQNLMALRFASIVLVSACLLLFISVFKTFLGFDQQIFSEFLSEQIKVAVITTGILVGLKFVDVFFYDATKLFITSVTLVCAFFIFIGFLYFSLLSFSGLALAISLAALLAIVILWGVETRVSRDFAKMLGLTSLIFASLFSSLSIDEYRFKALSSELDYELDKASWLSNGWKTFDKNRIGILGKSKEQLNIQWLGAENVITDALLAKGWVKIPQLDLKGLLMWLNTDAGLSSLGSLPISHRGQRKVFAFKKPFNNSDKQQLFLQFFKQDNVKVNGSPLWLASLTLQSLDKPGFLTANIGVEQIDSLISEFFKEQQADWSAILVSTDTLHLEPRQDVLLLNKK